MMKHLILLALLLFNLNLFIQAISGYVFNQETKKQITTDRLKCKICIY